MKNENTWSWDSGDVRMVSSVYRDASAKVDEDMVIRGKTETESVEDKLRAKVESLEDKLEAKPESVGEGLEAKMESKEERLEDKPENTEERLEAETEGVEDKLEVKTESIEKKADIQSENANGSASGIQAVETKGIEAQEVKADSSANGFILIDEPKSSAPKMESSFSQPEFQQIVLSSGIQHEKRQRSQNTAYQMKFDEKDISENKIAAIAAYLLGPIGIIIALLVSSESPYAKFHVRQALKMTICSVILELFAAALALFGMMPLVGIIFKMVFIIICAAWVGVFILRLIAITQVSSGEAKEPAIIKNFAFLK